MTGIYWIESKINSNFYLGCMAQRRQHLDIKDNFRIKLLKITFNFSNVDNPLNEALLVLLKIQSLLNQSFD